MIQIIPNIYIELTVGKIIQNRTEPFLLLPPHCKNIPPVSQPGNVVPFLMITSYLTNFYHHEYNAPAIRRAINLAARLPDKMEPMLTPE